MIESNGARIPAVGLGTWELRGEACARIVAHALGMGYRHVDTAQMYGNEAAVADGIRASGVARESIFLTSKVWPDYFRAADFARAAEERAEILGGPVDLLLLHWPNATVPLAETVKALVKAKRDGLARHIGVSNFTTSLVDEAVALAEEPLVANQVEYHPLLDQAKLIACCRRHGMAVTAYRPIARGSLGDEQVIAEISSRHGKSASQVALRWLIQQDGVAAIPRSSRPEHVEENLAVDDFALSSEEMAAITALTVRRQRFVNTANSPDWD